MELTEALAAGGIVPVVGAGGKKTAMAKLAAAADRATLTATVRIPKAFAEREEVARFAVTDDPATVVRENGTWPLEVVPGAADEARHAGYPNEVGALHDVAPGPVLVKADGARMRRFKAPNDREPQLPANADTVLAIASAHAVGEPLDERMVHRPELVSELTGRPVGDEIRPEDVAAVLAHERGGMKGVPEASTAIAVVNMIDDERLERVGRAVASEVLERADRVDRVVLTKLDESRVVGVFD
jgi:probable selenium-dependent hydroxylase accessory protein YqeC